MHKHKLPPMLCPADPHPPGSQKYAECLGNEPSYKVDRFADNIDDLVPLIRKAFAATPRPWEVWKPADIGPPLSGPDEYFYICTGYSYRDLYAILKIINPKIDLPPPPP